MKTYKAKNKPTSRPFDLASKLAEQDNILMTAENDSGMESNRCVTVGDNRWLVKGNGICTVQS
ncbi:MAG: hypothetical protein NTV57_12930 [Cyanobacteria bacterium]|nr:hypothetical protein [Cyanobacteriota bacterium]